MRRILIALIRVYQGTLSLWLGPCCRFEPSCSAYGIEALKTYPVMGAFVLIIKRIVRCRPGGGSGFDPVPLNGTKTDQCER